MNTSIIPNPKAYQIWQNHLGIVKMPSPVPTIKSIKAQRVEIWF